MGPERAKGEGENNNGRRRRSSTMQIGARDGATMKKKHISEMNEKRRRSMVMAIKKKHIHRSMAMAMKKKQRLEISVVGEERE